MELMNAQVADLKKSKEQHRHSNAELLLKMSEMAADLEEDKKQIKKLKNELKVSSRQHTQEMAKHEKVNCAKIKALQDQLTEQQKESVEKDNEIQFLHSNIQSLQSNIEAKDNTVSSLKEKVNQLASDLKKEQTKTCKLQRDFEAAVSQQQKEAEELDHLTRQNQRLASENKRLQGELEAALNQRQSALKQHQKDKDTCSRLEEEIKKEKARFLEAFKKIKMQEKELSEKTLALEKSQIAEKMLRSSLKNEKKRFEQMVFQKQATEDPITILSKQLREASASSESMRYDMQTLRMENADLRAKLKAMETEHDRVILRHRSLSECHEEMMSKKKDIISENQATIAKLKYMVDGLKARQSESRTRQAELEEALKQEKTQSTNLQQRADQITSALDKERTTCEKYRVELKEALTKQMETMEERQKLSVALQRAQDSYARLQEQQLAESNFQLRHNNTTELRLQEKTRVLDETTKALHNLQEEYADLGRKHSEVNSDYRDLLKTHSALQIRHERLSYAQGNSRPEFSLPQFSAAYA
ncbi:uncharacterized protein AKAME5_000696300 [Lates japonicus]|uniref:Uncharacterized protein n=1 Tax=Lates japonicus TaxID=270547 RepID=A0AAD3MGI2_LATJO|nr:uncharacterized protein AKAME5_000696300 [Lates japonicus]